VEAIGFEVIVPVTDVSDALRFLELAFAFLQAAQRQQSGQGIAQPATDLLEQPLFPCFPTAWMSALVQAETALAFGVLIVLLLLTGSLWIMAHLNQNMMPMAQIMQMQR
jgi:hypothetical protein